jgi:large repetitive protein
MLSRLCRTGWMILLALAALAGFADAQSTKVKANLITADVDEQQRTTLHGSMAVQVKSAADLGSLPANHALNRMVLVLKSSDSQQKDLQSLIEAQQRQGSPQYHKWLTAAEFNSRFSPSSSDIGKVAAWLQSKGFTGVEPSVSGQRIEFSGTVSGVEGAFQTHMHQYRVQTTTGTETHLANASEISIPAALSPVVSGVLSLNDFFSKPLHTAMQTIARNANGKLVPVQGNTTTTDGFGDYFYYVSPGDAQAIYGASSLVAGGTNGSGVSIGVLGRTDIELSDVQAFRTIFNLPSNDPNFIVNGPDPGLSFSNDQVESSLDVEWAGAMAPNATVNFVISASTDTTDGISLAAIFAVEYPVAPILTLSYGNCEEFLGPSGNQFWNEIWEQAAAEGISAFVASGDSGAAACDGNAQTSGPAVYGDTVNGLASTPFNVAVGGTQFNEGVLIGNYWNSNNNSDLSSAFGYIPEAAWNESCDPNLPSVYGNCPYNQTNYNLEGGGGGKSNCSQGTVDSAGDVSCTAGYAKPAWQAAPGVPADGVRDVPDVALNASGNDDPYIVCVGASCQYTVSGGVTTLTSAGTVGGTSAATPLMASIMALVEQKNGQYLGQPNYTLYKLAAAQTASKCDSSSRTDPSKPSSCVFNDITTGNNSVPGLNGYGTATPDFTTTAGYDLATGLGSVNVANLVANWNSVSSTASTALITTGAKTAKHGQPIQIAVKVAASGGATGTPTGDIAISAGNYGTEGQYTLASGAWAGSISDLPGGTYNLTAHYAGDGTFAGSVSSGVALTITPEGSKPTLGVELAGNQNNLVPYTGSPIFGTPAYFKIEVTGASTEGIPTGTVNVLDGTAIVATGALNSIGGALLSTTALSVGKHALTVSYGGDNSFNGATSAATTITVGKGETTTYPFIVNNVFLNQPSLLAVTVSGSGTATQPTGTVQFFDNGRAISGQLPVVQDGPAGPGDTQATFAYTYTTAASHMLTVSYSGDSNYDSVAQNDDNFAYSRTFTPQAVGPLGTKLAFKMTSNTTVQMGQNATFVATVSPASSTSKVPSGLVWILGNGSVIGSVNLTNGSGTGETILDGAGVYQLSAQYGGDTNFAGSYTPVQATLTVPRITPTVAFSAPAYLLAGTQASLNYTANGVQINTYVVQDPTGTVTFTDSVNGGTVQSLGSYNLLQENGLAGGYSLRTALSAGTHLITATYSGNPNFNPVTSTATVVVGSPDFVFTSGQTALTVPSGSSASTTLNLTPELGYAGTVSLACGNGVPAGSTCTISTASVTLGAAQTATLTISVPAASPTVQTASALNSSGSTASGRSMGMLGGVSVAGVILFFLPRARRRSMMWILLLGVILPIGCGGSGSPKDTLLAIASSNIKTASGSSVSFTATLSALSSNPTGTVTFYDGTTALGSPVAVSAGTATLQTSSLAVGAHTITAVYSGDSHNAKSTSIAIVQIITGATTVAINATSGTVTHALSLPVSVQ